MLAKAVYQSTNMLNVKPHSRASPLPHFDRISGWERLFQGHTRTHQSRIRRRHQPHRNPLEVIAHATLVGEAPGETAFEEEIGKARNHSANDVHATTRAGGQYVVAGHATQPAAELLKHFHGNRVARQPGSGNRFRCVEHRRVPIHRTIAR